MPRYKTYADWMLAKYPRYGVSVDAEGKYGMFDKSTRSFIGDDRWPRRKDALEFLTVALMLGKLP